MKAGSLEELGVFYLASATLESNIAKVSECTVALANEIINRSINQSINQSTSQVLC